MTFKEATAKHIGMKAMAEKLQLASLLGKQELFQTEFSTDKMWIEQQLSLVQNVQIHMSKEMTAKDLNHLRYLLSQTYNINGSLRLLEDSVLDDIGLFEIKVFALKCGAIRSLLHDLSVAELILPDLNEIVRLLDPEGLATEQFYIYSAYDSALAELRKTYNETQQEEIFIKITEIEYKIRHNLSQNLQNYIPVLRSAMGIVAAIDLGFAKAELCLQWGMQRPQIVEEALELTNLVYPPAVERLAADGKKFQPVNVKIDRPILLTGANMAGKTMLLRSLAFAQCCFQFGFFVPAESAKMVLANEILISIGDFQSENDGLSSFAAEILHINDIIRHIKDGKRYLVLIDELARSTNPDEGMVLVRGFMNVMASYRVLAVVTTHYSVKDVDARRLRVKGFVNRNLVPPININDIVENMDYSLIEDDATSVPQEALNLAKLLVIDDDWLKACENNLLLKSGLI